MKLLKSLTPLIAASAVMFSVPAVAEPILLDDGDIGDSFTIDYNGFVDGEIIDGLGAQAIFTLTGVTGDTYTFDYDITNTSGDGVTSRISSFSFNTDPNISGATSTGDYSFVILDSNYPNGIGTVDACFKGGASKSCAGNTGGVYNGDTGTGSLTLSFSDPIDSLTLSDFFVRYQSIEGVGNVTSASGSQTGSSTTTSSGGSSGTPVPAPGMLALFGMGLIGVGFVRRRRRPGPVMQALPA